MFRDRSGRVHTRRSSSDAAFQGFMSKAPVSRPWYGGWRKRYLVLEEDTLMWLPDNVPGSEPLGAIALDATSTLEQEGPSLTLTSSTSGQRLILREIDAGDAAVWAAAVAARLAQLQHGSQQSAASIAANAPLLASAPARSDAASSSAVPLLELKASEADWGAQWGARFLEERAEWKRSPLGRLRGLKWFSDFNIVLSSPMQALNDVIKLPNYQLTCWALSGDDGTPHARTVTLSDLGVPRSLSRHFFPTTDPAILTYGKGVGESLLSILAPSLIQLTILLTIFLEELQTAAAEGRSLFPMQTSVLETLAASLLFLCTLRGALESSREWLVIGFITSLRDKGRANVALILAGILDEACQLVLALSLSLLFVTEASLTELAFNCVALIFIMEFDNLLIKGSFSQNMATHELRTLTASVSTADMFLYSVAPADLWSPYGTHYASCAAAGRLHRFFRRWVYPIDLLLIPFVAPLYVFVCKLDAWPALFEAGSAAAVQLQAWYAYVRG